MTQLDIVVPLETEFARRHPASDGWRLHFISPSRSQILTPVIPAFLRAEAPAAVIREAIATSLDFNFEKSSFRSRLTGLPSIQRGQGLNEDEWLGEIDFEWKGVPIHYRRVAYQGEDGILYGAFVATKDWKALEEFWTALRRFQKRVTKDRSRILDMFEGFVQRPRARWSDLVLPNGAAEEIRDGAEAFFRSRRIYRELDLPYRRGFLFAGAPGTGKSLAVRALVANFRVNVVVLPLRADIEDRFVLSAFRRAAHDGPSILVMEDMERIAENKKVSLSFVLNLMDGISSPEGMLVVATTNAPEKLDAALLHRPSRFDKVWHFGLPTYPERMRLLSLKSKGRFTAEALEAAARRTESFTMAAVQEVVVDGFLKAASAQRHPCDEDLLDAAASARGRFQRNFKIDGSLKPAPAVGFGRTLEEVS